MEADEARDLIDEAVERAETQRDDEGNAERAAERTLRERVAVVIGILAVCLAIVHMAASGAQRTSLLRGIEASDTFAYMQAKIVREAVYKTASANASHAEDRQSWAKEAQRLRAPDRAKHGIAQLQIKGDSLRSEGEEAAIAGEGYELGETALQMAIVLLSIALVARSRVIMYGACALAAGGIGMAILTKLGVHVPMLG